MNVFSTIEGDGHEQVVFGSDPESGLAAIIAIHSTTLGPALGGTRMYPYDSEDDALTDVLRLSRGMSYKAAAAGLDLGGGKGVIIADPATDKSERLFRAYGCLVDSLAGRFVTAEDVGTTTRDMEWVRRETAWCFGMETSEGGSGDPSPATARGLMAALRAVGRHLWDNPSMAGRRVAIEGVGKVGLAFARLLIEERAEVVVADIDDAAADRAVDALGVKVVPVAEIKSVDCDVFSPCALGGGLHRATIDTLACSVVLGSANNQLASDADSDLFAARQILYAPDFVVNAGGLINVATELRGYSQARAFHRIDQIEEATLRILEQSAREGTTPLSVGMAVAEERMHGIGALHRSRAG